jgi:hypothetical protein
VERAVIGEPDLTAAVRRRDEQHSQCARPAANDPDDDQQMTERLGALS